MRHISRICVRAELSLLGGDFRIDPEHPSSYHVELASGSNSKDESGPSAGGDMGPSSASSASKPSTYGTASERLIEPGTPIIPYTAAECGDPSEHVRVISTRDQSDLRKNVAVKEERTHVLEHEAALGGGQRVIRHI